MSCQIGALGEREVHSIGEQLTSISGSMFSPEQIIKLYGCVPTRFLLREALNKIACAPAFMLRWPAASIVGRSRRSRGATGSAIFAQRRGKPKCRVAETV